ncbi:hypothetical protein DLAC_01401 [Tieghemostelium lacteum]|uniref:Uncharacterized protein n=1 Tax=Tieghemostelium lacteum TaxID=361077 RepID=A0A152A762_TIELA|nr:hypothetical protein DLAC_01401 [Tieghemostelium lacteum]|eukprot:KYR01897.1 hypothetical protein DLAC_01401 [Tieghemostelium lacteum]
MENVKKESQFCGADSTYFQDIVKQNFYSYNTDVNQTYIYTPIFCDGKFYENFYRLNYSRGSCSPGAGYWICIPIIILSLTNIIIYFCHYDHRNIKHSKNCPNDSSNDIKPTGIVLGTMAATKYNTNNGDIQKPVDRDHKRSDSSDSSSSSSSSDEKHEKHHNHHVSNPAQQPLPPPQVYPPPQQHQPYPYQPNVPYHQPPPQGYQPQPYQPPNTNNYYNQQPLPPPNANMHYGVDYSNDKPAYL